jgi:hypothetical protein
MAGVFIDIPGIGNVEAKNAASEATLKELLKVMQAVQKNTGGKGGASSTGSAGSAAGAAGAASAGTSAAKGLSGAASKAGALGAAFNKLATGPVGMVAGALNTLGNTVTNTISNFSKMGDSVESAADQLSFIPVVGGMFKAVASASQKAVDSYQSASKVGATFGGSVNSFAAAASAAGMTLDKFGSLIAKNGEGMLGFGSTVESGAKRFANVAKNLQATASGLQALGYSTEEINQGIASYGSLLRIQGQTRGKSDAELAAGAKNYLKEMDALAKATGMERSAIEEKMKQTQQDAQFHAFMSNKSKDVRDSFASLITTADTASPELAAMMKDYITTGSFTNAEHAKTASLMGTGAQDALAELRRMSLSGEKMTAEKQDQIFKQLGAAGKGMMDQFGGTLASTGGEFDHAIKAQIGLNKLSEVSLSKAKDAQDKAAAGTDGMNAKMEEAKKAIARISNEFTMFLANSGMLDVMMSAFKGLTFLIQTFVMPIFSAFAFVVQNIEKLLFLVSAPLGLFASVVKNLFNEFSIVFGSMGSVFQPVVDIFKKGFEIFSGLTGIIDDLIKNYIRFLMDGFLSITDTLYDYLYPAFNMIGRIASSVGEFLEKNFLSGVRAVADFFTKEFIPPIKNMLSGIWNTIQPVVEPIVKVFNSIKEAVGNFFRSFNTIGEVVDSLKLNFRSLALNLKEMWYAIKDFIPGLSDATPEERAALEAEKEQLAVDRTKQDEKLAANAAANLKEQKEHEAKVAKERAERDKKIADARSANDKKAHDHKVGLDKKAADDKKAAESGINYNDSPEALLKQYAAKEGSPLTPKASATQRVESTKKELEAKGEEKAAAEKKAQQEAEAKKAAEEKVKNDENKKQPAGQESAETLLAQLNSNMAQLIRINQEQKDIGERQLGVQRSLTGDLFASV